jgi:hypothetical protein
MGFLKWLSSGGEQVRFIGTVFHATCPKCKKVIQWPNCTNCGGNKFCLDKEFGAFNSYFDCVNCRQTYGSCTCSCGCKIRALDFECKS